MKIIQEETFGVENRPTSDIILIGQEEPSKAEKGEEFLICDAVFPCPCCNKRIKIQIRKKARTNHE